jgi:ABC-type lipoprotein export system ATPase subunit
MKRGEIGKRVRSMLERLGLGPRERALPSQLSAGEQQRVGIARALVAEPMLLVADEPTGNLDSENSARIMELLSSLQSQKNMTLIVVTHDPEVAAIAARNIKMRDGHIVFDSAA